MVDINNTIMSDKKKKENQKKVNIAQKDSVITHPNGSFTINGVTYPDPVQDVDPNQLSFGEWFAAEMRNNPGGVGTWRGKQFKIETKDGKTDVRQLGGSVKGTGNWSGPVPGMITGRHK
tara:strand:- start:167 stop:523 length:357 start_codon:yes stop_codon:yes gene_type:complete